MIRRGFAMLIVLGALVVLLTAAAAIARARATNTLSSRTNAAWIDAMTVAQRTDNAILAWLSDESASVVLAPDIESPMVRVLNHTLEFGGKHASIQVTAWDQCAMAPPERGTTSPNRNSGLDQTTAPESVYPDRAHPNRLGANLVTHNPLDPERSRRGAALLVNINTTPMARLDRIFGELGMPRQEHVRSKRTSGEPVRIEAIIRGSSSEQPGSYSLVTSSQVWSVRTDVVLDRASVSLWSVFVKRGGSWHLEQRIAIPD